ncbi:hypothetical protein MtrunA17_Chr4g0006311 [Medicago truncatula]|uniref:Uncharacterized protein n=1 Tax=Medicago truncatula TaxID=3880 RepID=A0A396HZN0_MEDTR|nr:hypothetical protein MtrunA17_Chr4g0006311 [Medicago truncatula]
MDLISVYPPKIQQVLRLYESYQVTEQLESHKHMNDAPMKPKVDFLRKEINFMWRGDQFSVKSMFILM